MPQTASQNNI